jgi:hypothetical protein
MLRDGTGPSIITTISVAAVGFGRCSSDKLIDRNFVVFCELANPVVKRVCVPENPLESILKLQTCRRQYIPKRQFMRQISHFVIGITLVVSMTGCTQSHSVGVPGDQVRFNDPTMPDQPALALNDRVKVNPTTGQAALGTLIELTPDMLYLGEGWQFQTDQIRTLHVSWGTQRLGTRGMIYGGLIGVGIGIAAGLIFDAGSQETAAAAVAIGLGGMLSGYWAGQFVTYENWKEVPPEEWRRP